MQVSPGAENDFEGALHDAGILRRLDLPERTRCWIRDAGSVKVGVVRCVEGFYSEIDGDSLSRLEFAADGAVHVEVAWLTQHA